jgi:hypothetical protein
MAIPLQKEGHAKESKEGSLSESQSCVKPTPSHLPESLSHPQKPTDTDKHKRNVQEQQAPTVYTVRLATGFTRGSGLNEPLAGVHLCLVGATGQAVLHWISPIFDPAKLQDELEAIGKASPPTAPIGFGSTFTHVCSTSMLDGFRCFWLPSASRRWWCTSFPGLIEQLLFGECDVAHRVS